MTNPFFAESVCGIEHCSSQASILICRLHNRRSRSQHALCLEHASETMKKHVLKNANRFAGPSDEVLKERTHPVDIEFLTINKENLTGKIWLYQSDSGERIVIPTGFYQVIDLLVMITDTPVPRPTVFEAFCELLEKLHEPASEFVIDEYDEKSNKFESYLRTAGDAKIRIRCSDGITLAVACAAPIKVRAETLQKHKSQDFTC